MKRLVWFVVALAVTSCGGIEGDDMVSRRFWGKTVAWPANTPTGRQETIINVAEPVTTDEGQPYTWGVQVQAVFNDGVLNVADVPSVRADLLWGVLGGSFTTSIDISKGASFNLVADTLRVTVVDETVYTIAPPSASPFSATGSASPIPIPKVIEATRTLYPPTPLVTGIAGRVEIPNFAKRISVVRFDASNAASQYAIAFRDQRLFKIGNVVVGAGGDLNDFNIPGNAKTVEIESIGAGTTILGYVFGLDL